MTKKRTTRKEQTPDLSETKAHLFIAGHELLRAAEGVLKYCKYYAESTKECKKHPHAVKIFSKGIKIAKDLGASMAKDFSIVDHFCNTIEKEVRQKKRKTKTRKK